MIQHTHEHLPLPCLNQVFRKLRSFYALRTKRLVNAFPLCHRPPTNPVGVSDVAKLHNYLQLANDEGEKLLRNDD